MNVEPRPGRGRLTSVTSFMVRRLLRVTVTGLIALLPSVYLNGQTPVSTARQRLIGYFPQWGLYDEPQYLVKNLVSSHAADLLDQLNYAQGFVTDGRCSIADPHADLNVTFRADQSVDGVADSALQPVRGNLNQLAKLKLRYPKMKLVLSLEGRGGDFAQDARPENREAFVASCVDLFVKGNIAPGVQVPRLFDGIDVDWEYPRGDDAPNFLALLAELRRQMDAVRPGLLLTIAVGPSPRMYEPSDFGAISKLVDEVGLMTYDFTGPWSPVTGFLSPLSAPTDRRVGTVKGTVEAFLSAGVPASKLLVGLPFYGYGWHQVLEDNHGLFQEGQGIRGDRPYRELETMIGGSTVYRDPDSRAPWLFDGDSFWTYDDPVSIRFKTDYVASQQLGGVMIWELGEDNQAGALLHSAYEGLNDGSRSVAAKLDPVGQ